MATPPVFDRDTMREQIDVDGMLRVHTRSAADTGEWREVMVKASGVLALGESPSGLASLSMLNGTKLEVSESYDSVADAMMYWHEKPRREGTDEDRGEVFEIETGPRD